MSCRCNLSVVRINSLTRLRIRPRVTRLLNHCGKLSKMESKMCLCGSGCGSTPMIVDFQWILQKSVGFVLVWPRPVLPF